MKKQKQISVRTQKQRYEVADVIREFEEEYRETYVVTPEQARVMAALSSCRTAGLGMAIYQCNECGALEAVYRSCRDRHCPKCCKFRKAQWIERQKVVLLPIPYFHITFTTDHAINKLVVANRKVMYEALFWAVGETLKRFGKKYLGGTLGVTMVLHTWGQKLDPHVHIHCIVTGGAVADDGAWQPSGKRYLFDVKALSAAYRDRFCRKIKRMHKRGELKLVGRCAGLDVEAMVAEMMAKNWEVYCKPFDDPEAVYNYLSKYVHQVAISNYRILKIAKGKVYFEYYDNKDEGKKKSQKLDGVEFLRRFLWHVLPSSFVRIRHLGLHNSYHRSRKLAQARQALGLEPQVPEARKLELKAWLAEILGDEAIERCLNCGAENSMTKRSNIEHLSWLHLLVFILLGLPLYGRVKA